LVVSKKTEYHLLYGLFRTACREEVRDNHTTTTTTIATTAPSASRPRRQPNLRARELILKKHNNCNIL